MGENFVDDCRVAVVATLVYLATQLKQNTRAVEHSIQRDAYQDGNAWLKKIENRELAALYRAGMREYDRLRATGSGSAC